MPDRTKREIVAAFNRLIARSEMEKITTLRIAEEAEVSKATFYRYFKDKYDVLNYNYQRLLDHSLQQCGNYRDLYFLLYTFAREECRISPGPSIPQASIPLTISSTPIPGTWWRRSPGRTGAERA